MSQEYTGHGREVLQQIPSLSQGDVLYASASATLAALGIGSQHDVLTVGGSTAPAWKSGLTDDNIAAGAAIATSKLADNDVTVTAGTGLTGGGTAALGGSVTLNVAGLTDSEIAAGAEIAVSKLADGAARQVLQTDAAGTGVEWTSNLDLPGTLDVTGAGQFDSTLASVGAATLDTGANGSSFGGNLTVSGDLASNGSTFTFGNNSGAKTLRVISSDSGVFSRLDGAAGNNRDLQFLSGGSLRWIWRVDTTAESGSDAGSNIALLARNDAAGAIDSPIIITRAAGGVMTLSRPVTIQGALTATFPNTSAGTGLVVATNDGSTQEVFRDSSSLTLKGDVTKIALADARRFLDVPAISYRMKESGISDWGFGAEHVHDAGMTDVVAYNGDRPFGFKSFGRGLVAAHHVLIQDHEDRANRLEAALREIVDENPDLPGARRAQALLT